MKLPADFVPALVIPPKGRAVLCVWATVPGLLLAPFVFWRSVWAGAVFCLIWAALVAGVRVRACSFVAALTEETLTVYAGVAFPARQAVPCRRVTGTRLVRTPLARLAGVSLLLVEAPGVRLFLAAVPARQAEQLAALLDAQAEGRA